MPKPLFSILPLLLWPRKAAGRVWEVDRGALRIGFPTQCARYCGSDLVETETAYLRGSQRMSETRQSARKTFRSAKQRFGAS
jgi:hypothetical protein